MSDLSLSFPDAVVDAIALRVVELLDERAALAAQHPEPWIDVDAAAAHIAKPRSRLYDLASQGALPHGRDGRSLLFRRSDLDAYLQGRTNGAS